MPRINLWKADSRKKRSFVPVSLSQNANPHIVSAVNHKTYLPTKTYLTETHFPSSSLGWPDEVTDFVLCNLDSLLVSWPSAPV